MSIKTVRGTCATLLVCWFSCACSFAATVTKTGATGATNQPGEDVTVSFNNNGDASNTRLNSFVFKDGGGSVIPTTGGTPFSAGSGTDNSSNANAFDSNDVTTWQRGSATNTKIGYQFASAVAVATIELTTDSGSRAPKTCRLRYSDDGVNYTTAFEIWEPSWLVSGSSTRIWPQVMTGGKYKAYRINVTANNGDFITRIQEIEMRPTVGGADQCNNGAAFGSHNFTSEEPSKAFDNADGNSYDMNSPNTGHIGYYFPDTVSVAQYTMKCNDTNARTPNTWKLQGSNDGATWTDLNSQSSQTWSVPETKSYAV